MHTTKTGAGVTLFHADNGMVYEPPTYQRTKDWDSGPPSHWPAEVRSWFSQLELQGLSDEVFGTEFGFQAVINRLVYTGVLVYEADFPGGGPGGRGFILVVPSAPVSGLQCGWSVRICDQDPDWPDWDAEKFDRESYADACARAVWEQAMLAVTALAGN